MPRPRPPQFRALALIVLSSLTGSLAAAPGATGAEATGATAPSVSREAATTTVSATLNYRDGSQSELPVWSDIRVSIIRNGDQVTNALPLPAGSQQSFFSPPRLLAMDLDDDADPEVLVDVFTAGFDCCRRTVLLHHEGAAYVPQVIDWGDGGYRLQDVVGGDSPEFLSSDGRFPLLFGSDARGPLRVLSFSDGRLTDVSLRALGQLNRDARIQARLLAKLRAAKKGDTRPVIAAYVADLIRLGRLDQARSVIRGGAARHELRESVAKFSKRIDTRLVAWGYVAKATLTASRGA